MVSRLVLGYGGPGRAVVDALAERRGDLAVVCPDESQAVALRDDGIQAEAADPADPRVLSGYDPDVVFVAVPDGTCGAVVAAARAAYPDAHLVVSLDWDVPAGTERAVADAADEVIDPGSVLAAELLDDVESEAGVRTRRFRETLRSIDGPLAVVTHDNPDPDAIASAVALVELAGALGVEADACYFGEISHQENRAMVNLLDLQMRHLEADGDGDAGSDDGDGDGGEDDGGGGDDGPGGPLAEYGSVALVDHSRPGVNDQLPVDTAIDIVIDHHPPRAPVDGGFVDLRHEVGATSTLLVDYFERLGVDLEEDIATALLYGIRVDTKDFAREVSTEDFLAASTLVERADLGVLERVENPSTDAETMEVIARAIRSREVDGAVLASYVGEIGDRDALAQAADLLLDMDGISTALVFGTIGETVYVSARARGTDLDLGETLRLAFDQIGSAGGHADMAGAQIPLTAIMTMTEEGETRDGVVGDSIAGRFFETVREQPVSLTERVPFGPGTGEFGRPSLERGEED